MARGDTCCCGIALSVAIQILSVVMMIRDIIAVLILWQVFKSEWEKEMGLSDQKLTLDMAVGSIMAVWVIWDLAMTVILYSGAAAEQQTFLKAWSPYGVFMIIMSTIGIFGIYFFLTDDERVLWICGQSFVMYMYTHYLVKRKIQLMERNEGLLPLMRNQILPMNIIVPNIYQQQRPQEEEEFAVFEHQSPPPSYSKVMTGITEDNNQDENDDENANATRISSRPQLEESVPQNRNQNNDIDNETATPLILSHPHQEIVS